MDDHFDDHDLQEFLQCFCCCCFGEKNHFFLIENLVQLLFIIHHHFRYGYTNNQ